MKLHPRIAAPLVAVGLLLTFAGAVGAPAAAPSADPKASPMTEANITRLTAGILEHSQFAHNPLDNELAGKFLDRYLDALDGGRSLLLQADVDEFAAHK